MKLRLSVMLFSVFMLMACGGSKKTTGHKSRRERQKPIERPTWETPKQNPAKLPTADENPPVFKSNIERYIYNFNGIAKEEMRTYGIPASITLAQGLLESDAGMGKLTQRSNNHFGIKCHGWKGEKVYHDDDRRQECFRKYKDPKYSFRDHSLFLKNRRRYAKLFKLGKGDYKAWAHGLKSAGYATDPAYPHKLISIIKRYHLHKYDKQVLGEHYDKETAKQPTENYPSNLNPAKYYIVKKGDTLYSIAHRFGLSVSALKQQNNLSTNTISIGQKLSVKKY